MRCCVIRAGLPSLRGSPLERSAAGACGAPAARPGRGPRRARRGRSAGRERRARLRQGLNCGTLAAPRPPNSPMQSALPERNALACSKSPRRAPVGAFSTRNRPPSASSSICSVVCSMPKVSPSSISRCWRIWSRSALRVTTTWAARRREAGSHRPDVQVVDRAHPVDPADRGAHPVDVEVGRRRLHQHVERFLQQAPGRRRGRGPRSAGRRSGRRRRARRQGATAPATITPSEPSASAKEWRRTPSRSTSARSPRARYQVAAAGP